MAKRVYHRRDKIRRTGPDGAYFSEPKLDDDDDDDDDALQLETDRGSALLRVLAAKVLFGCV